MGNVLAPRLSIRVQPPGESEPRTLPRIEQRIESWSFVDDESKADILTIELANHDLRFPDDPIFEFGSRIYARWGAEGLGPEHICIVQKWTPGHPKFIVEAHGEGITLNKNQLTEVWTNVKRSDVVRILAERFGYGPEKQFIEDTGEVYEHIQAKARTPAQLMRMMADRESKEGIPYVFYIDGTGLHFHPRRLEQAPKRSYEFVGSTNGPAGPGKLRKYPGFKASTQAKPGAVKVAGVDPVTGKKIEATSSNTEDPGRPGLAPVVMTFDKASGKEAFRQDIASTTTAPTGATTPAAAKKVAGAVFGQKSGMPVECTFEVDGDPYFDAKSVVGLTRIGAMLSGNYYVKKIQHQGKPGDYSCTVTARRDGVNSTGTSGSAAAAAQSSAKQNDAAAPTTGGSGAPPELEPKAVIDPQSGKTTYSYVVKTGQGASK